MIKPVHPRTWCGARGTLPWPRSRLILIWTFVRADRLWHPRRRGGGEKCNGRRAWYCVTSAHVRLPTLLVIPFRQLGVRPAGGGMMATEDTGFGGPGL